MVVGELKYKCQPGGVNHRTTDDNKLYLNYRIFSAKSNYPGNMYCLDMRRVWW